ncbi:MerR family transcriptional regulator [Kineothrix sedimenti]|uniref:Effector binding domain-containing protein n=1 Tax=Kineothrix sedimenti TaxID=3123317 RepID=A0ABZ3ES22_9FIRM
MSGLKTITQVTKTFDISTRTLRYYEQLGLIKSQRIEGYSYRVYDEAACSSINQILILRKLRIPLKQIGVILTRPNAVNATNILIRNIDEINIEMDSLSTIRSILIKFVDELREKSGIYLMSDILEDATILSMIAPLAQTGRSMSERRIMEDLQRASDNLNKLSDDDVRIVYLPPATVAAYQYTGDEPENKVAQIIDKFVLEHDLPKIKPDLRHYGFNAPNPATESNDHGYEMWVTIPEDMEVPEPLMRKRFGGGLYAAHMIPFGSFEVWNWFVNWLNNSKKYAYDGNGDSGNMFGWLEEELNYVNRVYLPGPQRDGLQLDLLIPIKEKK